MPHLTTFSHNKHALYRYGESATYDSNFNLQRAFFTDPSGISRRANIYNDISIQSINFSGSAFRSFFFQPLTYNTSAEFQENITNHVNLTGISIRNAKLQNSNANASPGADIDGNSGLFNFDNWNHDEYTINLITPRHAIFSAHPYDFCNQGLQANDPENFSCCVGAEGNCDNDAFYIKLYRNSIWMNNTNATVKPFSSFAAMKAALQARDTVNGPRIRNCRNPGDFFLIEFPNDVATSTNRIKFYNKLVKTSTIPNQTIVYRVRGDSVVYKEKIINNFNAGGGLNFQSINDGINNTIGDTWDGDSGSPIFIEYENDTAFGGSTNSYTIDQNTLNLIRDFILAGNRPDYIDLIQFVDLTQASTPLNDSSQFFGTSIDPSPLENDPYLSRFRSNEKESKNYIGVAYAPGNALQASELNEMQELIHRDTTLSNKFLSVMTIDAINQDGKLFRFWNPTTNQYDSVSNYAIPLFITNYKITNRIDVEGPGFISINPEGFPVTISGTVSDIQSDLGLAGWFMAKRKCGLHYFTHLITTEFFNFIRADTARDGKTDPSLLLTAPIYFYDFRKDSSLLDSISNFYGASRMKIDDKDVGPDGTSAPLTDATSVVQMNKSTTDIEINPLDVNLSTFTRIRQAYTVNNIPFLT